MLASINRIETAFGTNLNVSSAGALGWMQFIPSSWRAYGVDANEDGRKDPYNPVDAICAAGPLPEGRRGAEEDLRDAIFAYNHADWYVDEVLLYANQYAKLPDDLVGSLTGLTEGAHFPVAADARYADDISEREALERSKTNRDDRRQRRRRRSPTPRPAEASTSTRGLTLRSSPSTTASSRRSGENAELGKYIVLLDAYGNRYTYAELGEISEVHPVPKEQRADRQGLRARQARRRRRPAGPARRRQRRRRRLRARRPTAAEATAKAEAPRPGQHRGAPRAPLRPPRAARPTSSRAGVSGQLDSLLGERVPGYETFKSYFSERLQVRPPRRWSCSELKVGSKVTGGTVLGRIGEAGAGAPHVNFAIQPAGRGAPKIDPKPILDGWKLLETTAIYRAAGKDPFGGSEATIGQILLMSKEVLAQRVLADPRIEIYSCGRTDIESGQIDRRILAVLEYLAERGYRLTLTSLKCGHSFYTTSGNVSAHSSGNAVDIAQVNGLPILGNQGRGSITEAVVRDLLLLQGTMRPAQIITLMELGGPTFAMGDHDDHIHVGYTPLYGAGKPVRASSPRS